MKLNQQIRLEEMDVPKTVRSDTLTGLTSFYAGKIVPLAYIPLLREDALRRCTVQFKFDMMETAELLMNGVRVKVQCHFVPKIASERFGKSLDRFNRSYAGEPDSEGGATIPYYLSDQFERSWEIPEKMGINLQEGTHMNMDIFEAYNLIVNQLRKAASPSLPLRLEYEKTLAAAFWEHTNMAHIVPTFDDALMDGEIDLNLSGRLPVTGIGKSTANFIHGTKNSREAGGGVATYGTSALIGSNITDNNFVVEEDPDNAGFPAIFAELQNQTATLSLANIELAKKASAFAQIRAQYRNIDDEFIIDMLMQGIRVPNEQLTQPLLLGEQSTLFGYSRRWATDSGNLEKYVANGETAVQMTVRTPPMNTGGIVMFTAQVVPEQIHERQKDYFLTTLDPVHLPNTLQDHLDPQKVSAVTKEHFDVDHSDPEGIAGYAPLNHEWQRNLPRIGGKYRRPEVDASFDELRQRIWANETPDPELTEDMYLTNTLHHKVFASSNQEPFECTFRGEATIVGNTQFGEALQEAEDDYDVIIDSVETDRLKGDGEEA